MKTSCIFLAATLILLPWCVTSVSAQTSTEEGDKKIVITKRTVEADGTEITETIVKKGKAAENFDVSQYLRENRAENVELDVQIQEKHNGDNRAVGVSPKTDGTTWYKDIEGQATAAGIGEKRGFLGIMPKDGAKSRTSGVAVNIVKTSAAEKSGLRDGDILLQLDGTGLRAWDDISRFMAKTKPEQKVRVTYLRDGKTNTTEVVLGAQKSAAWDFKYAPNDLRVAVNTRKKDACLGVYSSENEGGAEQGARISDFTKESAAREAQMRAGDVITAVNGVRVQGHDQLWDEIAKYQPGEKITIEFLRNAQRLSVEASLKACNDNSNTVILNKTDESGADIQRAFSLLNWADEDEESLRDLQLITIRRSPEGDAAEVIPSPETPTAPDRILQLDGFRAAPNPTIAGQVTVEFRAPKQPIVVSLLDKAGRQLFREELNAFSGDYLQRFDLTEFANETILVHVQQGEKVYTEKIVLK